MWLSRSATLVTAYAQEVVVSACTIHQSRVAWGKFQELLTLLTNKGISLCNRGVVF